MSLVVGWLVACSDDDRSAPSSIASAGAGTTAPTPRAGTGGTSGAPGMVGTGVAGIAASACPPLRPVEDASCSVHTQTCTYDEIECRCPAGRWACSEPVDPNCPSAMPAHGSVCTVPEATECEFLQDECECTAGRWSCELFEDAGTLPPPTSPAMPMSDAGVPPASPDAGTRDAGAMVQCPDLRPIEGLSCTVSTLGCTYDTTHCVCPMGQWLCNERVDPTCPIETPTHGSACTGRADCDYFEWECECLREAWSCKMND